MKQTFERITRCDLLDQRITALAELLLEKERAMRELLETRIAGRIDITNERFLSRDKSAEDALQSVNRRLEQMNEFRGALSEQQTTFVTRNEYTVKHDQINADVRRIENDQKNLAPLVDLEKMEERMMKSESRLANWDGRLWALGTVFLLLNIFISWYMNSIPHAVVH